MRGVKPDFDGKHEYLKHQPATFKKQENGTFVMSAISQKDHEQKDTKVALVSEFGLAGISYWTVGRPFPQNWAVLRDTFNVRKGL